MLLYTFLIFCYNICNLRGRFVSISETQRARPATNYYFEVSL